MTEQLVVRYLDLESARVPLVVQRGVIGVDERQLLICQFRSVAEKVSPNLRTY